MWWCMFVGAMNAPSRAVVVVYRLLTEARCPRKVIEDVRIVESKNFKKLNNW